MLVSIWEQFLTIARQEAGTQVVETWLKAVSLYQWDSLRNIVYLVTPNSFVKEWIKNNYQRLLQLHLSRLFNVEELKVVFLEATTPRTSSETTKVTIIPAQPINQKVSENHAITQSSHKYRYQLNKNYSFETFVRGPHNQLAYAAAIAITQKLGKLYNPFFIYGGSGLGKTHLLHAIAHEIKQHHQDIEILYQPAERFVSEFINAIRFDKIHQFQAKFKNIDVFLVDDIQSICNKEQTQEAFFHIFNAMYDAHKQIIFSSDSYPADIQGLADRLKSRLAWGLVADIQPPSLETKVAIVKRKADLNHQDISDDVAHYIASQAVSNIRELEGALIRVFAYASLSKQPVTLDLAQKILMREEKAARMQVSFDHIMNIVQLRYAYTLTDLRSKNRSRQLVNVRQIAMYLMKRHTQKSLHEIALYLARQDHSTVIHAYKQVEQRMQEDTDFCSILKQIEHELTK